MRGNSSDSSAFGRFLRGSFVLLFLLVVILAVVLLVARGMFLSSTERAWQEAVTELEQKDPNWRWDQVLAGREVVPAERNSAAIIVRLRDEGILTEGVNFKPRVDVDVTVFHGPGVSEEPTAGEPLPMPDEWPDEPLPDLINALSPEVRLGTRLARELEREMARHDRAMREALKIAELPTGRHPVNFSSDFISTLLPTVQYSRHVAQFLALEATRCAQAGDAVRAMTAVRACINVARSLGDEPYLIAMLVRIAIDHVSVSRLERVLAQCEPSEQDLAAVQTMLEGEAAAPRMLYGLRGERAGMVMLCEAMISGKVSVSQMSGNSPGRGGSAGDWFADAASGSLARHARPEMLRLFTEMIETVQKPTNEWTAALKQIEGRVKTGSVVTRLLMPAVENVCQAELRNLAALRSAVAVAAVERFRLKQGRWPNRLDDLVTAGLLAKVPADPYDGAPLRMRQSRSGVIVYSIGPNGTDDGGAPFRYSVRPSQGDISVRVFDPRCRRMVAEPIGLPWNPESPPSLNPFAEDRLPFGVGP